MHKQAVTMLLFINKVSCDNADFQEQTEHYQMLQQCAVMLAHVLRHFRPAEETAHVMYSDNFGNKARFD